jgi:hypothetical protein
MPCSTSTRSFPPAADSRARLRFEFARLLIEADPATRTVPRFQADSAEDVASFIRDELIRRLTAGKCYR